MTCKHTNPQWRLTGCNEDGWACGDCGQLLGFRPDLDRSHTTEKVGVILLFLHEYEFMYQSNGSEGDYVTATVAQWCHNSRTFDQQSIIHMIAGRGLARHADFWRKEAEQFFCSHPSRTPRDGKLVCNACAHELEIKTDSGPLFSEEPF